MHTAMVGVLLVLGGLAAGAAWSLQDSGAAEPMHVRVESCRGISGDSEYRPTRAPDVVESHDVSDSEPLVVELPAGVWRARLEGAGAALALHSSSTGPSSASAWSEVYHVLWCQGGAGRETFDVRGDGAVTLSRWQGEDDGFRVG